MFHLPRVELLLILTLNLFLVMFLSRAAQAQEPYTLTSFENHDYRSWTFQEMAGRLGATKETLAPYLCDGKKEFDLYAIYTPQKSERNSLSVISPDSMDSFTYHDGQLFKANGKALRNVADEFLSDTLETLIKIDKLKSGHQLLTMLEQSPYSVAIRSPTDGMPGFHPSDSKGNENRGMDMAQALQFLNTLRKPDYASMEFTRIGAGGFINFYPSKSSEAVESDGATRPAENAILLGHELYHAWDGARGLQDRRNVDGDAYEFIQANEYRGTYFENILRKESGLLYRKYYSINPDHGSLLDSQGNPMLIPSPCLQAIPL